MKIKKTVNKTASSAPAVGGATIADRFKLDADEPQKKAGPAAKSTAAAFYTALAALVTIGVLTFILYKHWEFLMPA
jgi:hypothetical protein